MTDCILSSDPNPVYFFGGENDNKKFIGWQFLELDGKYIATIIDIWYEPDELYKTNDGYCGCAYKMTIQDVNKLIWIIPFRHITKTFVELSRTFDISGNMKLVAST